MAQLLNLPFSGWAEDIRLHSHSGSFQYIPVSFRLVPVPFLSIPFHSAVIPARSGLFRLILVYSVAFHSVPVFSNAQRLRGPPYLISLSIWKIVPVPVYWLWWRWETCLEVWGISNSEVKLNYWTSVIHYSLGVQYQPRDLNSSQAFDIFSLGVFSIIHD